MSTREAVLIGAVLLLVVVIIVVLATQRRRLGTPAERAAFATLHTASQLAPHLRAGLTPAGAEKAGKHLRSLLNTPAVALLDTTQMLAWDGSGSHHAAAAMQHAADALRTGRTVIRKVTGDPEHAIGCELVHAVIAPINSDGKVIGALAAYTQVRSAVLAKATEEVANWVSAQLALAELNSSRTRTMEAELKALRAQISPHFIYNCLGAIASFVRTDPDRARELLLEFADFSRYAFRRGGETTTLAEELRNVERYLVLEQARFGDKLVVQLLVAPEVLHISLPYLALQPLVENAVKHGLEGAAHDRDDDKGQGQGKGHVSIVAKDDGDSALISVEDDGTGTDPDVIRRVLAGDDSSSPDSVGLGNVDSRLRQIYGDAAGLVVETNIGAGMKVSFRVPKHAVNMHGGFSDSQ
ncbi:histidine kinase [Saxibacter everestensis]|uniref:Histidine kinase n=1 Tax=Saxibacter everestensis TaxID=2909229 RepID=A0ABY8QRW8_9MICO|nr:histidine kinase [Brevibacteriaceae bacterium ZFBP1038]